MPQIPVKTQTRPIRDIGLGREQAFDLPGIREQTLLKQFSSIAKSGAELANIFFDRQEKKKKESDDLAANEAYLGFVAASREKELEFNQLKGADAEGMFVNWKKEQDKIWKNSSANLTEDQRRLFDQEVGRYGLEVNSRIATRERKLHEQRIRDNIDGKSVSLTVQALDSYNRPQLFYQDLAEASALKNERLRLDGVDENLISEKEKLFVSQTVREAITRISTESLNGAEIWFKEANKKKELTFNDSFELRVELDKRKKAKDDVDLRIQIQNTADKLISENGEDRATLFRTIEKQTSGKVEDELKKEINIRLKQISDQSAENNRKLKSTGRQIIDQATNASEAFRLIDEFIKPDPAATLETVKQLESYVKSTFITPASKRKTNPAALQEAYNRINKTIQGIASQKEIIENAEQLIVEYTSKLSSSDLKNVLDFQRNGGFLGQNTYDDILKSFADLKQITTKEARENKSNQTEFQKYLDHVVPLLPSDKVVNSFDLRRIGAGFFALEEGETPTPRKFFFGIGLDESYDEARKAGRELSWLPTDLDESQLRISRSLLAQENDIRRSMGKSLVVETDTILMELYKEQIMRLPHRRETR